MEAIITEQFIDRGIADKYKDAHVLIFQNEIKSIAESAFENNQNIQKIHFKEDVHEICDSAFSLCHNLKEVVFKKCDKLDNYVFYNCTSLENFTFDKIVDPGKFCFVNTDIYSLNFSKIENFHGNSFANVSLYKCQIDGKHLNKYSFNRSNIEHLSISSSKLDDNCFYDSAIHRLFLDVNCLNFSAFEYANIVEIYVSSGLLTTIGDWHGVNVWRVYCYDMDTYNILKASGRFTSVILKTTSLDELIESNKTIREANRIYRNQSSFEKDHDLFL